VAITYDYDSGTAVLYYNGNAVQSEYLGSFNPLTFYDYNYYGATLDLYLGVRLADGTYYRGLMDEVSLYSRALDPSEIATIYNSASAGKCLAPTGVQLNPAIQAVCPGATVILTPTVSGVRPFTYLWKKDGSPISGGTNSSLKLINISTTNLGIYSVHVTGPS
jgi:hypothetical protein